MNPIIVIPARMASSRLPGKPLADIHGRPMIVHVWERAMQTGVGPVLVACGEEQIADAVRRAGGQAVMTPSNLPSGSDRVHAALESIDPRGEHDVVVNLQGDVPTVSAEQIRAAIRPLRDPPIDIGTVVAPIASFTEANTASFVKAACVFENGADTTRAIYFSRSPVPWGEGPLWHHVGIYAYRRAALARFVALPPTLLERREQLEQLRAIEAGMRIGVARVAHGLFGVDTPEDLERVRELLS